MSLHVLIGVVRFLCGGTTYGSDTARCLRGERTGIISPATAVCVARGVVYIPVLPRAVGTAGGINASGGWLARADAGPPVACG